MAFSRLFEDIIAGGDSSTNFTEKVVELIKEDPSIIDAYYDENDKYFYGFTSKDKKLRHDTLYRENSRGWGLLTSLSSYDKLIKFLNENGYEIGGVGNVSNNEAFEFNKNWNKENPRPLEPWDYKQPREQRALFSPSAHNPKNKAARELLQKYKNDVNEWRERMESSLLSDNYDAFKFDLDALGHGKEIEDFYKDTKYWGD